MCGLFGVVSKSGVPLDDRSIRAFRKNASLAQRRGSDASGLAAVRIHDSIDHAKSWVSIAQLLRNDEISHFLEEPTRALFGHSRLETHGFSVEEKNNQPVVSANWVVLHNGIITNHVAIRNELEATYASEPVSDSDTFAVALLLEEWIATGRSVSLESVLGRLEGELTIIGTSTEGDLFMYTNVGNLYRVDVDDDFLMVGSEPRQLEFVDNKVTRFPIGKAVLFAEPKVSGITKIRHWQVTADRAKNSSAQGLHLSPDDISNRFRDAVKDLADHADSRVSRVVRCRLCLLPDSFPNLEFDSNGVCSVCSAFVPPTYAGLDALRNDLREASPNGADVLVCLSGGRDSCYVLHLVAELGFNPIAYTYDWGMVTTAARENMARMCGKLGVEHILVSPNIQKNRDRVRRALLNWLRKPDIATIPILMAGDKPYFRYAGIISDERDGLPAVMADHHLETTGFKSMLAGAVPSKASTGGVEYRLTGRSLARMGLSYMASGLANPPMLRSILVEGVVGFVDYYVRSHSFVRPFMYVPWDEASIEETLIGTYGWSKGADPNLPAWRMGDATAPFYNLVYKMTLGMTEHDALRSNQIRYGLISRDEAMRRVGDDNEVSVLGLAGYLATAGLSEDEAIEALVRLRRIAV